MGLFFLACGALRGVAFAEGLRLPLSTSRLHSLHTREEVGEVEDVLREDSYGPLCLDSCLSRACTCRAVRERDVQSPDVRSRERACTCLHRVWCSQSRSCLLSRLCGTFLFSVRGAVWRRVCGRSPPPCPKGATSTSAHTARSAPSRCARAEVVPRTLALSPSYSVSSRRLSVSVSARASLGVNPSSGLHPRAYPSSGYTFGRSIIRLLPVLTTNQWLALHQRNLLMCSPRK